MFVQRFIKEIEYVRTALLNATSLSIEFSCDSLSNLPAGLSANARDMCFCTFLISSSPVQKSSECDFNSLASHILRSHGRGFGI
jgi:hypothetical protein